MAWHSISIINPPISTVALIQKHFNFCGAYFKTVNENRTEIMCQNLFTGRTVQNVVKIIILPQNMFH